MFPFHSFSGARIMEVKQFLGLQVFEFAYLMALAFLPFFVAQREVGLTILTMAFIYIVFSVIKFAITRRVDPANRIVLITGCDSGKFVLAWQMDPLSTLVQITGCDSVFCYHLVDLPSEAVQMTGCVSGKFVLTW